MIEKKIEGIADAICAELLISKHSKEYRVVAKILADKAYRGKIQFDENNVPKNFDLRF